MLAMLLLHFLTHNDMHTQMQTHAYTCMRHTHFLTTSLTACIGFSTNGEWNSLRLRGNTRPLSFLLLTSTARSKYSRMGYQTMINILTPRGMVMIAVLTGYDWISACS